MSAKKASASAWVTCGKCRLKFMSRQQLLKHFEKDCTIDPYPYIDNAADNIEYLQLIAEVVQLPQASMVSRMELTKSNYQIFLPESFMKECNFKTFSWVKVSREPANMSDEEFTPFLLEVWPLSDKGTCSKVMLSANGLFSNWDLRPGKAYSIERYGYTKFAAAWDMIIDVGGNPRDYDADKLIMVFKHKFKTRPVAKGNTFMLEYYAQAFKLHINLVRPAALNYDPDYYYRVTYETRIFINHRGHKTNLEGMGLKLKGLDDAEVDKTDIGGLDFQFQDLMNALAYMHKQAPVQNGMLPRGILIYGHHGTGKSMFGRAICNSFGSHSVVLELQAFSGYKADLDLKLMFDSAIKANHLVIILIEDIEDLAPNLYRGDQKPGFASVLRREMHRTHSHGVYPIVIATTSNIDRVDASLRSHIFSKEVEIPVPDLTQRQQIINKIMHKLQLPELDESESLKIAQSTQGFVGADLLSLLTKTKIKYGNALPLNVFESLKDVRPSALKSFLIETPNVQWTDIGGMEDLKYKLRQTIEWPLTNPESFITMGITPPKGVLLYGPPGCSKTMIAKALATQIGVNFISVKGSELFSKWVGESEKAIQNLFRKARQVAPCVLFFDEIDSMGGERGLQGSASVNERVLAQMLVEMDGVEQLKDVTIIAATNRPDLIDQALLRPGRLDRLIYVPLPDGPTRHEIFSIRLSKMPGKGVNIDRLVELTDGYSGAEITAICQEAGLNALKGNMAAKEITDAHFLTALDTITKRTSPDTVKFYEDYMKGQRSAGEV